MNRATGVLAIPIHNISTSTLPPTHPTTPPKTSVAEQVQSVCQSTAHRYMFRGRQLDMSSALAISNVQSDLEALKLAQRAPEYLEQQSTTGLLDSIPFISSSESSDLWMTYEKLMVSCLRTGDEKSAHLCLERLIKRFGASNERIMGLRGLYQEACAEDNAALEQVLQEYGNILKEDPTNMVKTPSSDRGVLV